MYVGTIHIRRKSNINLVQAVVAVLTSIECFTVDLLTWSNSGSFNHRHSKLQVKMDETFKGIMALLYDMLIYQRPETESEFCMLASLAAPKT